MSFARYSITHCFCWINHISINSSDNYVFTALFMQEIMQVMQEQSGAIVT